MFLKYELKLNSAKTSINKLSKRFSNIHGFLEKMCSPD